MTENIIANPPTEETAEDLRKLSQSIVNIRRMIEAHCTEHIEEDKELNSTYYFPEIRKLSELLRAHTGISTVPDQEILLASLADDLLLNKCKTARAKKQIDDADDCLSVALGKVQKKRGYSSKPTTGLEEGPLKDYLKNFLAAKRKHVSTQSATNGDMQQHSKIKLSDHEMSFDDDTAQLKVGDLRPVDFPPFKNEYYIMKELFAQRKGIVMGWDVLHAAMSGGDSEAMAAIEPHKQKKAVQDAIRAINKRVKNKCNTDDELLKPEIHSIKRLY